MQTLYHGTIDKFAQDILRTGLQPHPENAWNIQMLNPFAQMFGAQVLYKTFGKAKGATSYDDFVKKITYNPSKDDEPGFVYLIDSVRRAAGYARGKADYYRTRPGDKFFFQKKWEITKALDAPFVPDAKPVVLQLHLPNNMGGFEFDPRDADAVRHKGAVDSKYITLLKGLSL